MIIQGTGSKQIVLITHIPYWLNGTNEMLVKKRSGTRPSFAFDIYSMLYSLYNSQVSGVEGWSWNPLWLSAFNSDSGTNVVEKLPSAFAMSKIAKAKATGHMLKADFSFSPLVPYTIDTELGSPSVYTQFSPYINDAGSPIYPPSWNAECLMWIMSIYPMLPLMVYSSVSSEYETNSIESPIKYNGPLFAKSINFECSEGKSVNIQVDLEGSKYVTSLESDDTIMDSLIDPLVYNGVYRTASFVDCRVSNKPFDINTGASTSNNVFQDRIVKINLNIEQQMQFDFTCNNGWGMMSDQGIIPVALPDSVGPRFVGLKDRNVKGSITVLSNNKQIPMVDDKTLFMYFGGTFYFPMLNVEWQRPSMSIETSNGWLHTYNFIALADPNAVVESYSIEGQSQIVSEFNMNMMSG
jgi:hypothetical protein